MRCNVCGKENPDNVDLCTSCGNPLTGASSKPNSSAMSAKTNFAPYFRSQWRAFVVSPMVILFVLLYSACVVLNWIGMNAEENAFVQKFGIWGHVIDMVPSTLTAVALWLICANAFQKSDAPIRTVELRLILVMHAVNLVILSITSLILLLMSFSAFLLILVSMGLVLAVYIVQLMMILTALDTVRNDMPNTQYAKALAIIEFVAGGLSVLSFLWGAAECTLGNILSCAMTFVAGVVLLQYKELMETLEYAYIEMEVQGSADSAQKEEKTEYIPAWKRVQMEKEHNEQ